MCQIAPWSNGADYESYAAGRACLYILKQASYQIRKEKWTKKESNFPV